MQYKYTGASKSLTTHTYIIYRRSIGVSTNIFAEAPPPGAGGPQRRLRNPFCA